MIILKKGGIHQVFSRCFPDVCIQLPTMIQTLLAAADSGSDTTPLPTFLASPTVLPYQQGWPYAAAAGIHFHVSLYSSECTFRKTTKAMGRVAEESRKHEAAIWNYGIKQDDHRILQWIPT